MKVGIGQDSHRFDFENKNKKLVLGGVIFENETPLLGNSDADVVLHSITNAVSGITCKNILGKIQIREQGKRFLKSFNQYLNKKDQKYNENNF